jgi:dephospho-CoA kinase
MDATAPRSLSIGLTGGIGSGKSTVASMLVAHGAVLVDTDAIGHALTAAHGAAMPALKREFGGAVAAADGALDRQRMREIVFADAAAKGRLESILHPMIGDEAHRQADAAAGAVVVFDVPLLSESSAWRARVQRVLVIDCDEDTQVRRVMVRSAWDEPQVRLVIAQQASRAARRAIADAVLYNDGLDFDALGAQVDVLWAAWRALH